MKSTIQMLSFAASAAALTTSSSATQNGCYYSVAGVGNFNYHMNSTSDLTSSIYTVANNNAPFARRFDATNIGSNSANNLLLTVPGAQLTGPISSAQLTTSYSDILYGSVRTIAKVSNVPGTTHGFTFYANDTQEIDFAFITGDSTIAHFTNEQVSTSSAATSYTYTAPSDATTAFHEYRVDWIPGSTMFYIDSVLVKTITGNVPTTPGFWLWNNWSNGNVWAAGPPTLDNTLTIQSINAYFNRTSVATSIANGATCSVVAAVAVASSSTSAVASSAPVVASSAAAVVSSSAAAVVSSATSVSSVKASTASTSVVVSATVAATVALAIPVGTTNLCPTYNGSVYTDSTTGYKFQVACNTDFAGGDMGMTYVSSLAGCISACASTKGCVDVALSGVACYMKNTLNAGSTNSAIQGAFKVSS